MIKTTVRNCTFIQYIKCFFLALNSTTTQEKRLSAVVPCNTATIAQYQRSYYLTLFTKWAGDNHTYQ